MRGEAPPKIKISGEIQIRIINKSVCFLVMSFDIYFGLFIGNAWQQLLMALKISNIIEYVFLSLWGTV